MIFAIDPGPTKSAWVLWDPQSRCVTSSAMETNDEVLARFPCASPAVDLVIEKIESFGMAVGASIFETVFWSGRFAQAWGRPFHRLGRRDVKLYLCGTARAKDANIRQAILDLFGGLDIAVGKKATPGPLYGISSHRWAALAVALTWEGKQTQKKGS